MSRPLVSLHATSNPEAPMSEAVTSAAGSPARSRRRLLALVLTMAVALTAFGPVAVPAAGALAGKVLYGPDFTSERDGVDRFGHGTFVAGLIAGQGTDSGGAVKGVAPGAHIVSIKIAGADGRTDLVRLLAALEWVVTFKD